MTNGILAKGFNAVGFGLGKLMSNVLSLLHKLVGGLLDRLISTRLQRLAFVGFGRFNALRLTVAGLIAFRLTAWNHPQDLLPTVILFLTVLPVLSMYYRLTPVAASMIVTSCYGRQLRVHLPDTTLRPRDIGVIRQQTLDLMRVALDCRARTLSFDSPLLVADSTYDLLATCMWRAVEAQSASAYIEVRPAKEVDIVAHGNLSVYAGRYEELRQGRVATGPKGRLLSRRLLVHLL
ncbi:hypothetical protein PQQ81_08845 [Paraburkholderia strydomiana]|uniref:hypothetical protein n=1 Tax=Paraburkholderia strydomiana TaxID=1245417 RepID=UPI0038BB0AF2